MKGTYSKKTVFTLKDSVPELPENATIEDLYPRKFLDEILKSRIGIALEEDSTQSILFEVKRKHADYHNKEKMDRLKTILSEDFITKYKDCRNLEEETPSLASLIFNLENLFK